MTAVIGFTGTRRGMTPEQRSAFESMFPATGAIFHHGDCVGADADAHAVAAKWAFKIIIHPPADEILRAWCKTDVPILREPKSHFARNRDIVNETDMLIACPWQTERPASKTGGGTWYTIEYAEKVGKPVVIIWPDGRIERREGFAQAGNVS